MKRLKVNINDECAEVLQHEKEAHGRDITETIRRAISIYHYLLTEVRAGKAIIIRDDKGRDLEMVWLP